MKWLWALIVGWLAALNPVASPLPSPSPLPALKTFGEYRYAQVSIDDPARLRLGSNLPQPKEATAIKEQRRCDFLSSAGFYDTENRHLGWLEIGGRELNPAQINRLFDGFFALTATGPVIEFSQPKTAAWGLQSGPVLVYGGRPLKLTIKDDQPRRRIVAALARDRQLIFYVLLSPQSNYAGPLLADTPRLILELNPRIESAINLDGGSASAFLSETVFLKEYSPLGGFFCYTKE